MKITEFATLAEAKAYSEIRTRMISPDMMLAFLTSFKLVNNVFNGNTDEAKALQIAMQFGSEFNLIKGHPSSVEPMLDILIEDGLVTEDFKNYAVNYANQEVHPYYSINQQSFDLAKLSLNPKTIESGVVSKNIKHIVKINVLESVPGDDVFTIKANTKKAEEIDFYVDDNRRAYISVKPDEKGLFSTETNISGLSEQIKYKVTSKFNRNFSVEIVEV